jgi:hypothetical protein
MRLRCLCPYFPDDRNILSKVQITLSNLEHSDCAGRTSQCIRKSFPTAKLRLGYRTATRMAENEYKKRK